MRILQPPGWKKPRGYSNGVMAEGVTVFIGGQIGWDEQEVFQNDGLVDQIRQALKNTVSILAQAGVGPETIARMTWYVTDKEEYLSNRREIGRVYREIIGDHYPAMTMVQVSALVEDRAKVEIESTAVIPATK